ncbi:ribose transport system permease protein [Maritalea mobilis]|uniref:Ribose transport system permease protein n=1 Tax=Maritalea mobilis TaxID=483324 RepID=A0A4R6VTP3_9HYPH|nr:ABC transporter permease [Maritalea mobilis]TDQ66037.1 ribose transport system permease protein [Maritalea mobilis]
MTTTTEHVERKENFAIGILRNYPMEIILGALIVFLIFMAPGFASTHNLLNVLRTVSMLGIIAFGMTAVIISGEIDLSVGAGVALAGCIVAWFAGAIGGWGGVAVGFAVAVSVGFSVGFLTGQFRRWFDVPTFITTLALFAALRGVANLITGGFPLTNFPSGFDFLGGGYLFGIPFPVYVFAFTFVAMHFIMNNTSFGRAVYAVGGNLEAARLSGINVWLVKSMTLAITGVLTAISGTLIASQIGSGTGTTATGMELDVIAAVIIGGTSLFGGKGRIWGTLIGVLFLGCISNGMTLMNVSEYWQYVVRGGIILGAVLLNQVLERVR